VVAKIAIELNKLKETQILNKEDDLTQQISSFSMKLERKTKEAVAAAVSATAEAKAAAAAQAEAVAAHDKVSGESGLETKIEGLQKIQKKLNITTLVTTLKDMFPEVDTYNLKSRHEHLLDYIRTIYLLDYNPGSEKNPPSNPIFTYLLYCKVSIDKITDILEENKNFSKTTTLSGEVLPKILISSTQFLRLRQVMYEFNFNDLIDEFKGITQRNVQAYNEFVAKELEMNFNLAPARKQCAKPKPVEQAGITGQKKVKPKTAPDQKAVDRPSRANMFVGFKGLNKVKTKTAPDPKAVRANMLAGITGNRSKKPTSIKPDPKAVRANMLAGITGNRSKKLTSTKPDPKAVRANMLAGITGNRSKNLTSTKPDPKAVRANMLAGITGNRSKKLTSTKSPKQVKPKSTQSMVGKQQTPPPTTDEEEFIFDTNKLASITDKKKLVELFEQIQTKLQTQKEPKMSARDLFQSTFIDELVKKIVGHKNIFMDNMGKQVALDPEVTREYIIKQVFQVRVTMENYYTEKCPTSGTFEACQFFNTRLGLKNQDSSFTYAPSFYVSLTRIQQLLFLCCNRTRAKAAFDVFAKHVPPSFFYISPSGNKRIKATSYVCSKDKEDLLAIADEVVLANPPIMDEEYFGLIHGFFSDTPPTVYFVFCCQQEDDNKANIMVTNIKEKQAQEQHKFSVFHNPSEVIPNIIDKLKKEGNEIKTICLFDFTGNTVADAYNRFGCVLHENSERENSVRFVGVDFTGNAAVKENYPARDYYREMFMCVHGSWPQGTPNLKAFQKMTYNERLMQVKKRLAYSGYL